MLCFNICLLLLATKHNRQAQLMYMQANQQIEKWSEIVFISVANVSPYFLILPKLGVSLFAYFNGNETSNDAWVLPIPTW